MKSKLLILLLILNCSSCKRDAYLPPEIQKMNKTARLTWIADSIERYKQVHLSSLPHSGITEPYNNILRWEINKKKKQITVWLAQNNNEGIDKFRKHVLNSPLIKFRKSSPLYPAGEDWQENDFWCEDDSYRITIPQNEFTLPLPEEVTVTLFNNTEEVIGTGLYYNIDYKDQDEWKTIQFIPNDDKVIVTFDMEPIIHPHSSRNFDLQLYPDYYDYQPGEYRITKYITIDQNLKHTNRHTKHWEKYHLTTYFRILP